MTPHQTQEVLRLVAALWPRHPLSEDTLDAWAVALTPIDYEIAKRAVIAHSRAENGHWPPAIADISAAMRAEQRKHRPASPAVDAVRASAAAAHRDTVAYTRRITQCQTRVGTEHWMQLLDDARAQLIAEYHTTVIPTRLIANRACELAEAAQ